MDFTHLSEKPLTLTSKTGVTGALEIHFRWPATLWAENLETEKVGKTSKAIVGSQSHSESIVLDSVFDSSVYSEILIFWLLFLGKIRA